MSRPHNAPEVNSQQAFNLEAELNLNLPADVDLGLPENLEELQIALDQLQHQQNLAPPPPPPPPPHMGNIEAQILNQPVPDIAEVSASFFGDIGFLKALVEVLCLLLCLYFLYKLFYFLYKLLKNKKDNQ